MTQDGTATITIAVDGMTCMSCVGRVRSALAAVPGVAVEDVTLRPGAARVTAAAGVDEKQLIAAVEAAGYRADSRSMAGLPVIAPAGSCCN